MSLRPTPEALQNPAVAVFASGSGTTFEAFGHSIVANELGLEIRALICDRPAAATVKALGLNATHGWDIEPFVISKEDYPKGPGPRNWDFTDEQSDAMLGICQRFGVGTIVLLGLTSRVRGSLFEAYGSLPSHKSMFDAAAINTHPGVVELTRGLHGFEVHERMWQLAQDGEIDYTEQTVHVVTAGYDEGATFRRNRVGILPAYSAKDVEAAVQAREKATIAGDTYDFAREREAYLANAA